MTKKKKKQALTAPTVKHERSLGHELNTNDVAMRKVIKELGEEVLVGHIQATVPVCYDGYEEAQAKRKLGAYALYLGLHPQNTAEAMLASLAVATTNMSLESLACAARAHKYPHIRELNLKCGIKGALTAAKLLETIDSRRQSRSNVNVGNVNVEAGGQAIVGSVETGRPRGETEPDGVPPLAQRKPRGR